MDIILIYLFYTSVNKNLLTFCIDYMKIMQKNIPTLSLFKPSTTPSKISQFSIILKPTISKNYLKGLRPRRPRGVHQSTQ